MDEIADKHHKQTHLTGVSVDNFRSGNNRSAKHMSNSKEPNLHGGDWGRIVAELKLLLLVLVRIVRKKHLGRWDHIFGSSKKIR